MRKLTHEEISAQRFTLEQLRQQERHPVCALLDNVRSLYNVGSMFRTADGARVGKLILTGYTPYPPRREIEKTALGATKTVPWEYIRDPLDALRKLRTEGFRICVLEHTTESIPCNTVRKDQFPLCLIVGNEITGVTSRIIEQADLAVEIPMYGMKQSLNAAVAFGIAVFDLVRIVQNDSA
jgi:23S rRNA (guanosine2251-2'-O)-methyltransferase